MKRALFVVLVVIAFALHFKQVVQSSFTDPSNNRKNGAHVAALRTNKAVALRQVPGSGQPSGSVPVLKVADTFYYPSPADGTLTPIEKEIGSLTAKATQTKGKAAERTAFITLSGAQAKVRINHGERLEFFVRFSERENIRKFSLYSVVSKDDHRGLVMVGTGKQFRPVPIRLGLLKLGEVYKLTPTRKLPPGEYVILSSPWQEMSAFERGFDGGARTSSTQISGYPLAAFCFGIDDPKTTRPSKE